MHIEFIENGIFYHNLIRLILPSYIIILFINQPKMWVKVGSAKSVTCKYLPFLLEVLNFIYVPKCPSLHVMNKFNMLLNIKNTEIHIICHGSSKHA